MEKKTLSQRTAEKIMDYIKINNLVSGEKLPTETELQSILGAGRNTVREAVRILASRNILVIRQGAGTFLAENPGKIEDPLGFSFIQDTRKLVEDLTQVRLMIEPQIAALAAQNATEEEIVLLENLVLEVEQAIDEKRNFSKEDMAFHRQLAVCSRNHVISNLIPVINEGVSAFAMAVDEQEFEQTRHAHRKILEAIKNREPLKAEQAMTYHLLFNINRF